jgi:hypothetical protein
MHFHLLVETGRRQAWLLKKSLEPFPFPDKARIGRDGSLTAPCLGAAFPWTTRNLIRLPSIHPNPSPKKKPPQPGRAKEAEEGIHLLKKQKPRIRKRTGSEETADLGMNLSFHTPDPHASLVPSSKRGHPRVRTAARIPSGFVHHWSVGGS